MSAVTFAKVEQTNTSVQEPDCLQQIGNTLHRIWTVICEKGCLLFQLVYAAAIRCIAFVSPALANRVEAFGLYLYTFYLEIRNGMKEKELQGEIDAFRTANNDLHARIHEMTQEITHLEVENEQLALANKDLGSSKDDMMNSHAGIVYDKLQAEFMQKKLQEQCDALMEQQNALLQKNQQLALERTQAITDRNHIAEIYKSTLNELGALQSEMRHSETYQNFDRVLQQVSENDEPVSTVVPEFTTLTQAYIAALKESLETVPTANVKLRTAISGIVKVSERQTYYFQTARAMINTEYLEQVEV